MRGAPLGDPKDMPPAKQWPNDDGWQLAKQFGQPDLVIKSEPYTMPAKGQDVWFKPLTTFRSPSRAGCGRSRCGRRLRRGAGLRITLWRVFSRMSPGIQVLAAAARRRGC